jgi:hypothetical protein
MNVLVLHPRHKLEYFKRHNWDASWIDTARQIVRNEFDRSYASLDIQDDDADMRVDTHEVVCHFFPQNNTFADYSRSLPRSQTSSTSFQILRLLY